MTGSGKTHTLVGQRDGVMYSTIQRVFENSCYVQIGCVEVYNGKIIDRVKGIIKDTVLKGNNSTGNIANDNLSYDVKSGLDEVKLYNEIHDCNKSNKVEDIMIGEELGISGKREDKRECDASASEKNNCNLKDIKKI